MWYVQNIQAEDLFTKREMNNEWRIYCLHNSQHTYSIKFAIDEAPLKLR